MYCRVLEGRTHSGKITEAIELVAEQIEKVKRTGGFMFVQALQSEDDLLVVSSWRTEKDLRGYAESELAHELLSRLSSLMVEKPTVRNFAMKLAVEGVEGFFTPDEGGEG
jgi:heme-degrading monooxygenase HmoA